MAPLELHLNQIFAELDRNPNLISPQLERKLVNLIECDFKDLFNVANKVSSVINRLLLELVQTHYNTKQKEQDLLKLVKSRGCTLQSPQLIDSVIQQLIKLYTSDNSIATSFERNVLIKYLMVGLEDCRCDKRQIEKVVQTLYKSDCFNIIKQDNAPARFSLKEELCQVESMRRQLDAGMIKLAQSNDIRLPPDSWAYLLHGTADPDTMSNVQSLLDKYNNPVSMEELRRLIYETQDKFGVQSFTKDIEYILKATGEILDLRLTNLKQDDVVSEILSRLVRCRQLFTFRQQRTKFSTNV